MILSSSELLLWGGRKTIRRGRARPDTPIAANDLIFNYRATRPSWYCCPAAPDAA